MKRFLSFLTLATMFVLVSCSGGGSGGSGSPTTPKTPSPSYGDVINGVFLDAPIEGLSYSATSGQSGVTNSSGEYECQENSTVTFSIGSSTIGTAECKGVVTPIDLVFGTVDDTKKADILAETNLSPEEQTKIGTLKNMLRTLQSLSESSSDGLKIDSSVATEFSAIVGPSVDFSKTELVEGKDLSTVITEVATSTSKPLTTVSQEDALSHFTTTLSTPIIQAVSLSTQEDTPVSFVPRYLLNGSYGSEGTVTVDGLTNATLNCDNVSCTLTPDANTNGTLSLTYKVSVNGKESSSKPFTVVVSPVNDAPVVSSNSQTVTTAEDTAVNIQQVSATDVDNSELTFSVATNPTNGTLSRVDTEELQGWVYNPASDFNGTDSFTYTVSDGSLSQTVSVSLTVTPVNDAPSISIASTTHGVKEGSSKELPITVSDVDGDTLTITASGSLAHGTFSCVGTTCSYTATSLGTDVFDIQVSDGTLTASVTGVTVNVTQGLVVSSEMYVKHWTNNEILGSFTNTIIIDDKVKLLFKSNRGDDATNPASASSMNLVYEFDTTQATNIGNFTKVLADAGATNQTTVQNVGANIDNSGTIKVRVTDTISNESSEWKSFTIAVIRKPTATDVPSLALQELNDTNVSLSYNANSAVNSVTKIVLTNLHSSFESQDLVLLVDNTVVPHSSSIDVLPGKSIHVRVKEGVLSLGETNTLFNYKVETTNGLSSSVASVNATIQAHPVSRAKALAKLHVELNSKINEVIKSTNPYSGWVAGTTCSLNNGNVVGLSLATQTMIPALYDVAEDGTFVFQRDTDGHLYVSLLRKKDGYKVLITPRFANGDYLRQVGALSSTFTNGDTYNYSYQDSINSETVPSGNPVNMTHELLQAQMNAAAKTLFVGWMEGYRNVNDYFDIVVVFSDSDVTRPDLTEDKLTLLDGKVYLTGKMKDASSLDGETHYKLSYSTLCDAEFSGHSIETLVTPTTQVPTMSYNFFGDETDLSQSGSYKGKASVAFAFDVAELKLVSDNSTVFDIYSPAKSFLDASKGLVGSIIQTVSPLIFSYNTLFDNAVEGTSLSFPAQALTGYVYSFKQVEDLESTNKENFFAGAFVTGGAFTPVYSYDNRISTTEDNDGVLYSFTGNGALKKLELNP